MLAFFFQGPLNFAGTSICLTFLNFPFPSEKKNSLVEMSLSHCTGSWDVYADSAVAAAELIPWIPAFFFFGLALYSGKADWSTISWVLFLILAPLYPAQAYFNDLAVQRCTPMVTRWNFPNPTAACIAVMVFMAIGFRVLHKARIPFIVWLISVIVFIAPFVIYVAIAGDSWWKVFWSLVYGMVMAIIAVVLLWQNQKQLAYLFSQPPFVKWYPSDESHLIVHASARRIFLR